MLQQQNLQLSLQLMPGSVTRLYGLDCTQGLWMGVHTLCPKKTLFILYNNYVENKQQFS